MADLNTRITADGRPATKKSLEAIEAVIGAYCETPPGDKEGRLCYYLDPIKREVSQPMKNGVPTGKLCDRLKKKSAEICTLRFAGGAGAAAPAMGGNTDFSKLRIGQLVRVVGCGRGRRRRGGGRRKCVSHPPTLLPPTHSQKTMLMDKGVSVVGLLEKEDYVRKATEVFNTKPKDL